MGAAIPPAASGPRDINPTSEGKPSVTPDAERKVSSDTTRSFRASIPPIPSSRLLAPPSIPPGSNIPRGTEAHFTGSPGERDPHVDSAFAKALGKPSTNSQGHEMEMHDLSNEPADSALDDLISELDNKPSTSSETAAKKSSPMDDLDTFLNDLAEQQSSRSSTQTSSHTYDRSVRGSVNRDELDTLLNDLEEPRSSRSGTQTSSNTYDRSFRGSVHRDELDHPFEEDVRLRPEPQPQAGPSDGPPKSRLHRDELDHPYGPFEEVGRLRPEPQPQAGPSDGPPKSPFYAGDRIPPPPTGRELPHYFGPMIDPRAMPSPPVVIPSGSLPVKTAEPKPEAPPSTAEAKAPSSVKQFTDAGEVEAAATELNDRYNAIQLLKNHVDALTAKSILSGKKEDKNLQALREDYNELVRIYNNDRRAFNEALTENFRDLKNSDSQIMQTSTSSNRTAYKALMKLLDDKGVKSYPPNTEDMERLNSKDMKKDKAEIEKAIKAVIEENQASLKRAKDWGSSFDKMYDRLLEKRDEIEFYKTI